MLGQLHHCLTTRQKFDEAIGLRPAGHAPHSQQLLDPIAAWGGLSAARVSGLARGRPGLGDTDLLQDRLELSAVRPLAWCDDQRQRAAAAVGAQVELGGEICRASGPCPHLQHHLLQAGEQALPRRFALVFWDFGPL
ncbi:hypothetical protein BGK72_37130 [Streptomyces agglomeratus]|nr:hypothetical protein BGK72_37130 [Streptomyces agglomeratus]